MKLFRKHKPVLIFSVYQHEDPAEDRAAHAALVSTLLDTADLPNFKIVEGRYNGDYEVSILTPAEHWQDVLRLAYNHEQKFVMYLDEYRKAFLINVALWMEEWEVAGHDATPEMMATAGWPPAGAGQAPVYKLGQFYPTSAVGRNQDYTFDRTTGLHYVTERD